MRILIVRLSAIGDVVMASGLIPALHQRFPGAQISWLTEPVAVPLLRANPQLHEVLVWRRDEWRALWKAGRLGAWIRAVWAWRRELRSRRFDLVMDAQGLLKSGILTWFTGAPRRVGLLSREGSQWLMHQVLRHTPEDDPGISPEYRCLAAFLGADPAAFRLNLVVGDAARKQAAQVLAGLGVQGDYVVLCPFTTRPQKHWVESRWAELAEGLQAQGLRPVLLGAPADQEAAQRILAAAPSLVSAVGRMKLDESVAAVQGSALLVGVDTGLTHMGTALGIPTVGIFGSTRPYLDALTPKTRILYQALACSPCGRHPVCGGRFDCMSQWQVPQVLAQAMHQLGRVGA